MKAPRVEASAPDPQTMQGSGSFNSKSNAQSTPGMTAAPSVAETGPALCTRAATLGAVSNSRSLSTEQCLAPSRCSVDVCGGWIYQ